MNKLLSCTAALLLLLGTHTALADGRHDRGWDRGHSRYDHHDNGRGWAWGRRDRDHWERRDRDRVSVSLNFGTVPDWRYRDYYRARSGLGIAYTTTWGAPRSAWGYDNRPVIVHQNTYINEAPRTRVVTRSSRSSTNLLRDINGRCFERSTDSRGNETRVELPSSSCNF